MKTTVMRRVDTAKARQVDYNDIYIYTNYIDER